MSTLGEGGGHASVLVIGYGNPDRCDDGLGPALAARLAELNIPGVRVDTEFQLNPEAAATVAEHEVAIFIDACLCAPPPFFLRKLEPRANTVEFTTHALAPEGVLGIAHDVYGAPTRGYALAVRGYHFDDFGEELTKEAGANLEAAVAWLVEALQPGGMLRSESELAGAGS